MSQDNNYEITVSISKNLLQKLVKEEVKKHISDYGR